MPNRQGEPRIEYAEPTDGPRGVVEWVKDWARRGRCTNDFGEDVIICVDGKPKVLKPGETSPAYADCDGIVLKDGSGYKVHGRLGVATRVDRDFVRAEWPDCFERARGK